MGQRRPEEGREVCITVVWVGLDGSLWRGSHHSGRRLWNWERALEWREGEHACYRPLPTLFEGRGQHRGWLWNTRSGAVPCLPVIPAYLALLCLLGPQGGDRCRAGNPCVGATCQGCRAGERLLRTPATFTLSPPPSHTLFHRVGHLAGQERLCCPGPTDGLWQGQAGDTGCHCSVEKLGPLRGHPHRIELEALGPQIEIISLSPSTVLRGQQLLGASQYN